MEMHLSVIDILIHFGIGVIASFVFIFSLLYILRPSILIAGNICKEKSTINNEERDCFIFKIVNLSFFEGYDMRVELIKSVLYGKEKERHTRITPLSLLQNNISVVSPYRKKDDKANYAMRFRSIEDLHGILNDSREPIVKLRVTLKHGVSGLSNVFTQEFVANDLKTSGTFGWGMNCTVS